MTNRGLFQIENEVIAKAQETLHNREAGPSEQDFQWMLDQYIRLVKQCRRLVKFGDRMQTAVSREIAALKREKEKNDALNKDLRETSTLLNTILDAIPDVIGVQDAEHGILRYNKAGYEFLGKSPEEVHGKKCHQLIGQERPCRDCAAAEVYCTRKPARTERYIAESETWFDVRAYPVLDENGFVVQVIEHLRDISSEMKTQIHLREAHERLVTILDSIDAHIFVADIDTHEILFMNRKMVDDFNEDYTGRKCYESFQNATRPCDHCPNKALLDPDLQPKEAGAWQSENPVTNRCYLNFDRAIQWVDGQMVKIRIATDITDRRRHEEERRQMQMQIQQSQKFEAIGTLAAGVAHDFNNLLMGIQGQASLLELDLASRHPHMERIQAVYDYVESAKDLTQQLLGMARGGKYEVRPTDINRVVEKSVLLFGRTRKEIRIHERLSESPPVVKADRRQMEQVFLNLLLNAWQAMPKGGEIHLETAIFQPSGDFCRLHKLKAGPYVRISVQDNGTGMDAATCERVFDPFFSTKAKGRGTGLGLASAYGIIKNHAGTITVESQPGSGSCFCVFLPFSSQKAAPVVSASEELLRGSETILLIDDEEMVRDVGGAMLESLGYKVLVAQGGEQGVERVHRNGAAIDLVILDMVMPGLGGARAFEKIQAIRPGMPVLLSSGYSMDGQANDIMERGCNGFIQKPFRLAELSKTLRAIIDIQPVLAGREKERAEA